tara:strand:- start:587 stop:1273 length:687 start_codon:yes stop_codon:yes gene_type:complete
MRDNKKRGTLYLALTIMFGILTIICFATFMIELNPSVFECDNGKKIPGEWVNDGANDCSNGSDEKWKPTKINLFSILMILSLILFLIFTVKTKRQVGISNKIISEENKENQRQKKERDLQDKLTSAKRHEKLLELDEAAEAYKELGMDDDVIRIRKIKSEKGTVKITKKVVHGDEVTKTEIKDSVLNRSNIGGSSSKMQELEKLAEMKKEGLIDDDEFKQMKKEILAK